VHSVLLLDGFDEIAITATAKKRQFYFVELSKLLGNSTHSIIATRPSYFSSIEELKTLIEHSISGQMQEIPDLVDSTQYLSQYLQSELEKRSYGSKWVLASIPTINTFVVQGLSREMILAYLGHYRESLMKSYGMDEKAIFKQLEEIYDISDLIQRPLLLDIIVFVLGTGRFPIKKADQVSATMLYNIYVQEQVKYEIGKGSTRVFLTPGERIMFARAMALAMLEGDGSLAVSYPALIDLIARNRDIFEGERQRILDHSLESVATDVCVCGFLTLRHDSKFEFVHKSFFEFFVAYAVRDEIVKRKGAYLQAKTLPWEILYFLGGFLQEDSALRDQVANELDQRRLSNRKRRTLLGAKLYSELTTSDATFDDFSFDDFDLKKKIFSKCIMRKMRLAGGGIGDIAFDRCDMKEVCLIDSKINSIEIIDCEGGIGIERGAVNKVVCQTPRGNEFNIKVLCECRTLILAGVRGQILGRALGGETKIEHSRIIVDEFATDKDSEEFGRVSHSELLFGNPKFSGSRDEEFRELITAVGAKYRRLLANCSHADLINVVMTFTQFERVTKELSARRGNRLIVRVFEFDGESKEFGTNVYPLGKEEIVADVTGRCVGILVNRMERTRVEKLDKLIRSCENDPDRSFDELTKKLAAL
jgi:hypothetical protein